MTNKELTQIRESLSLTKKEFAQKIGSTAMMIGRYENGSCKIPDAIAMESCNSQWKNQMKKQFL